MVRATKSICKALGLIELLDADSQIGDSHGHAFALVVCLLEGTGSELPVRLSREVLGMVAHDIGELAAVKASQVRADLVRLECLVEVDADLSSDLRKHS